MHLRPCKSSWCGEGMALASSMLPSNDLNVLGCQTPDSDQQSDSSLVKTAPGVRRCVHSQEDNMSGEDHHGEEVVVRDSTDMLTDSFAALQTVAQYVPRAVLVKSNKSKGAG
jgi:hypothetical protein